MNIREIALRDDIPLLEEWLDIGIIVKHEDVKYIFRNCTNRIKEYYIRRYENDHYVICIAIDSGFLDRQLTITDTLENTLKYITNNMIESNNVVFMADILHNLPCKILSIITMDNVNGNLIYSDNTVHVLKTNPKLVHVYNIVFDAIYDYDCEILAILIQNDRVTYRHSSVALDTELLDIVEEVRKIIPNWFVPLDSIDYNMYVDLDILHELVGMGIVFPYNFSIDLYEYDEDMFRDVIEYADDETLLEAYMLGYPISRPKPTTLRLNNISDECIGRLFELGEEYWIYCTINIYMFNPIDLSDDSLKQLNTIISYSPESYIYGPYSYCDLILLYEFIDGIENHEVVDDSSLKDNRQYTKYKRGISRLWNQFENQPQLVMFICNNLPSLVLELYPPIDSKYYKFMSKKLLSKLNRLERIVQYSDVAFIF